MGFRRLSYLLSLTVVFAVAACGDNKHPIFEDANTDMGGSDMVDAPDAPPDAGCPSGQTLCGTECVDVKTDDDHCGDCDTDCGAGTCQTNNGTTICCPTGQTNCNGTCVDLTMNDDNCGACGTDCGTGTCQTSGSSTMCCPAGQTNCDGVCIDTMTDNGNCGACASAGGDTCNGTNELCCGGTCVDTNTDEMNCDACGIDCDDPSKPECKAPLTGMTAICCAAGESNCNGVCSNPVVDDNNCGGCGIACTQPDTCQAPDSGSQPACCESTENNCDGVCSDPLTDNMNCGTCGNACTGTDTCTQGICCGPGEIKCGNVCVDPDTNPDHCGGCNTSGGTDCPGTDVCSDGTCQATCDVGETSCSGACVDTDSDPNNCGGCAGVDGTVCASNEVCSNGTCTTGGCTSPEVVCDGACVDTDTDENHCGSCDGASSVCGPNQTCDDGICCDGGEEAVYDPANPSAAPICCPVGYLNCGGVCADPEDENTCGSCTVDCGAGICTTDTGGTFCCPAGTTRCGSECVDLTTSEQHCGACGAACTDTNDECTAATGGTGSPECCNPDTELNCGGDTCVDKLENDINCGTCGNDCTDLGMQCSNGECCGIGETNWVVGTESVCCPTGEISCDGITCIDLTENATCGTSCEDYAPCPLGEFCNPTSPGATTGVCEVDCGSLTNCSGSCVDTQTDENHCGACDDPCPVLGQECSGGVCGDCPTGPADGCGGVCVDTSTSETHCGGCAGDTGETCAVGEFCTDGHCCADGTIWCDSANACVDPTTDNNNCGSCGTVCDNGTTCQNGACACPFGSNVCPATAPGGNAGECHVTSVDPTACGVNCLVCGSGQVCVSGGCRDACPAPLTECLTEGDDTPYPNTLLCVNTGSNSQHCGSCGNDCPAGTGCSNGSCVPLVLDPPPATPAKCVNGGPPISVPTGGGAETCTGNLGAVSFLFGLCTRTNFGPISRDLITDAFDSNVAPYISSCTTNEECSPQKLCTLTEAPCSGTGVSTCLGGALDICDFPVKCVGGTCAGGGLGVNGRIPSNTGETNFLQESNTYTHVGGDFWVFGSLGLSVKGTTDVKQRLVNQGPVALTGGAGHVFGNAVTGGGWTSSMSSSMLIDGNLQTMLPTDCASLPAQLSVTGTESCGVPFPALGDPCGAFDNSDGSLLRIADVIVPHFRNPANNDNALIGLSYDALNDPDGPRHLDLPCGVYYLNTFTTNATTTIAVHGRTAIIFGGAIDLAQPVFFDLDPNATLDIFAGGVLRVSQPATLGSPAYPAKTRMYFGSASCTGGGGICDNFTDCCSGVCSACPVDANGQPTGACSGTGTCSGGGGGLGDAISLSQGGYFNGLLWAGYGTFTHQNPLEMYGAIYTRYFDASGDTIIHYDNAAADLGDECPPTQGSSCESCRDCNGQACVGNTCGSCTADSDCCPPLICNGGTCTL